MRGHKIIIPILLVFIIILHSFELLHHLTVFVEAFRCILDLPWVGFSRSLMSVSALIAYCSTRIIQKLKLWRQKTAVPKTILQCNFLLPARKYMSSVTKRFLAVMPIYGRIKKSEYKNTFQKHCYSFSSNFPPLSAKKSFSPGMFARGNQLLITAEP